jgi:hypothetical protein
MSTTTAVAALGGQAGAQAGASAAASAADDFAQPIYMDEQAGGGGVGGNGSASALDQPVLNLDDPNLLNQEVDLSSDVDPYAAPPPLPDGRWLFKVKQRDVKGPDGQPTRYKVVTTRKGQPLPPEQYYVQVALDGQVIDPSGKYDGITVSDYNVTSRPDPRKGNQIPMKWILSQLKVQLPVRGTPRMLLDEWFKATASEPMIEVETVWEGSLDQADQERFDAAGEYSPRVLGQHRFPQDSKGNPIPDMDVETKLGKVHLHARPRINGYFAVGSAKASGVEYGPKGR